MPLAAFMLRFNLVLRTGLLVNLLAKAGVSVDLEAI